MRRADNPFYCDHGLPWDSFNQGPRFHTEPLWIQFRHPPKHRRKQHQRLCWVWPHDRKQRPSSMSRLADILTGRGPDIFFCSSGKRPARKEWMDPSRHSDPRMLPCLNRDGYKYNGHSRTYEQSRASEPKASGGSPRSAHHYTSCAPPVRSQRIAQFAGLNDLRGNCVRPGRMAQHCWTR
jgi:hypothetical protein